MNHHHHPQQLASNSREQEFSLPPSASSTNNPLENSVPASRCGGSLPNMTLPNSPHRHHFPKSPSHSPARVLPPLPPPPTLRRSVSDLNHSPAKTSSRSSTCDLHFSTDLEIPYSKGLSRMNHHHPRQIPFKYPEQDSSLPPSASTADNPFDISLPASRCGGSLPNMTTPYSPDRYYFSKTPSHSSPHSLRRSVSNLNHSPAKTSSRSSTSSQDFHFSTNLDTPDSKGLSRMNDRLRNPNRILPAPVVPAGAAPVVPARAAPVVPDRATSNPTFLLSLLALYMTLSMYPQNMKRVDLDGTLVEACSGILISVGMEATFYVLINWVADQQYPLLSWLALIIGKILFWISQYRNLPFMVFYPTIFVLNALLLGSLAIKVTWNVGWGVAYQFLLDNLGILNLF
ncbi:hypothetical protein ACFX15_033478 [Malus domestica]